MAKWVCTICGYECEGDAPYVLCFLGGAGYDPTDNVYD